MHIAKNEAKGQIICYLCDDDLWLPHHLDVMNEALEGADFVNTVFVKIHPDGPLTFLTGDLQTDWSEYSTG